MSDNSVHLVEQVKTALIEGRKLNILGHGTKQFMGRVSSGDDLCVADHTGIVDYQAKELVITARAGTRVSEIQAVLAEQNQTLTFDPPTYADCASIGGTLACHLSGPGRPWLGSVRDMVLGTRLINGRAEHLRFGGQVIKNVAGYDASRLQAGAMGTLGIITEISLKVLPKPAASVSLVQEMHAKDAIRLMNELSGQAKPLTAACWLDNKLYLRLSGAKSAVDGTVQKWPGEVLENASRFWSDLLEHELAFFQSPTQVENKLWRFSIKSSAEHFLPDSPWLIDWGGSQRWLTQDATHEITKSEIETAARSSGGQVCLFRGGDRTSDVMPTQSSAMKNIMCRVKKSFDPTGLFNPGRLYSWM